MSGGGERRVTVSCCVTRSRVKETEAVCRVVERDVSCCVMRSRLKETEAVCRVVERDVSL